MKRNIQVINGVQYTNVGTHTSHCCNLHGCKYGKTCPVKDGAAEQQYGCERCASTANLDKRIAELQEEREWSASLEARGLNLSDSYYDSYY